MGIFPCLHGGAAPGASSKRVAAQMGMQVMHWEKMGVMAIFGADGKDAARQRLVQVLAKTPSLMDPHNPSRDNVGAALFHWAVIHRGVFQNANAAVVTDYLLEHHPEKVRDVYYRQYTHDRIGLFDGESALHLSVAFGDLDLVKRLLAAGADPASRAYGTFFHPSGSCYFGEYPLSFAIACGNVEMAKLIVSEGRDELLTRRDSYGNTALHIAALHRRRELLDWLLERMESKLQISKQDSLNLHGAQGLTPLGLSAVLAHNDDGKTFDFILERMSRIEWVFGRVTCTSVPLEQIDTIPLVNAETADHVPTLALVLCRRVYGLSTHPHLVGVVEAKWSQFGQRSFFTAMIFHLVRLCLLTWLASYYRDGTRWMEENDVTVSHGAGNSTGFDEYEHFDALGNLEWVLFVDCVLNTAIVFLDIYAAYVDYRAQEKIIQRHAKDGVEVPAFLEDQQSGTALWAQMVSSVNFMNFAPSAVTGVIDQHVPVSEYDFFAWVGQVCMIVHFVSFEATHIPNEYGTALLSFGMLTLWMSTLKFTGFSRNLGMLSAIVIRTIKSDVTSFIVVFTVFLLGFGSAIHIIHSDVRTTWGTLDVLAKIALGDTASFATWASAEGSMLSRMNYVLHLWYAVCALVILLNLLISIFSGTFQRVQNESEREWRLSKGRVVFLFERRMRVLFPFYYDSLRVNHFDPTIAEIDLEGAPNDQHRYVFMTEQPDDDPNREENEQRENMKNAMGEVLSDHGLGRFGSGHIGGSRSRRSTITRNGTALSARGDDGPVNMEDVILHGLVGKKGLESAAKRKQGKGLPQISIDVEGMPRVSTYSDCASGSLLGSTVALLPAQRDAFKSPDPEPATPIDLKPHVSAEKLYTPEDCITNSPLDTAGCERANPNPLGAPPFPHPEALFDEIQGPGTWTAFMRWSESEFGHDPAFDRLSHDDLLSLLTLFFPPDVPRPRVVHCADELYKWASAGARQGHVFSPKNSHSNLRSDSPDKGLHYG
eukprot:TRINITY_DN29686_c0_g1_i1.p1 TRINITY_DN29686_c0_g1~~TRINITY_DN29686_c0_g1_i1.p1  ORF type:complete len:993 (+),score=330.94 TRINITY_DN29686_c0_g1_i1:66-3044(+)